MRANEITEAILKALDGRRLLDHPFYQRWEKGELAFAELGTYAEQYRQIEQALPVVLAATAEMLPVGSSRLLVEENLNDERTNPAPHVELFEGFATAVGATVDAPATKATEALVDCYRSAAKSSAVAAIATIAAYEVQAADIATSKSDGLRRHYGLSDTATTFWDVHSELEAGHAEWSIDALVGLDANPVDVFTAARASADAWWSFLDDREAAAVSA